MIYEFVGHRGPWKYASTKMGKHKAVDSNGFSIVTTPDYGHRGEANARLCAAAPEMLYACIMALDQCTEHIEDDWYVEIRKAVEKALNINQ